MRNLMISSILATDMGLHFEYMKKLESLQTKLRDGKNTEEWNESMIDEQKALACALLIKCADISNVVSLVTPPDATAISFECRRLTSTRRHEITKRLSSGCSFFAMSSQGKHRWKRS